MKTFKITTWTPCEDTTAVVRANFATFEEAQRKAIELSQYGAEFFESLAVDGCPADKVEETLDWYYDNCGYTVEEL